MSRRPLRTTRQAPNIDSESSESEEESTFGSCYDSDRDPEYSPSEDESSDDDADLDNYNEILMNALEDEMEGIDTQDEDLQSEEPVWTSYTGRHKDLTFDGPTDLQRYVSPDSSPLEIYNMIIDDEIINLIVTETNRFGLPHEGFEQTTAEEIRRFFFLAMYMGLVKLGAIPDYWSTSPLYNLGLPRKVMTRNRFQTLLKYVHFADNAQIQPGDRLGKIKILTDLIQKKFKALYCPGEEIVIDESLIPWRGRLLMRQYIPNKAHRYGVKLFKLCSLDGYTWAFIIYSGKSGPENSHGLASKVCLELSRGLLDQGRTLYVDNYYTSYPLAVTMLDRKTHVVGTVRANRKQMPNDVMTAKLKRGEIVAKEDQHGIVVLNWKDTRNVRMLSTKHEPILAEKNRPGNQNAGQPTERDLRIEALQQTPRDENADIADPQQGPVDNLVSVQQQDQAQQQTPRDENADIAQPQEGPMDDLVGVQQQDQAQQQTPRDENADIADPQQGPVDNLVGVQQQDQAQQQTPRDETADIAEPQEGPLNDLVGVQQQDQAQQQTPRDENADIADPQQGPVDNLVGVQQQDQAQQQTPRDENADIAEPQQGPVDNLVGVQQQDQTQQQTPQGERKTFGVPHQNSSSRFTYMLEKRRCLSTQTEPNPKRATSQTGPNPKRSSQSGPSCKRTNIRDQARPSRQRANTKDQARPSRQRANTESQARPSRQRANTEDQAGPSRQRANTEDQARPSRQRANTEDQAGPSRQRANTEDQARPSRQRANTEDQAGPSRQRANTEDQAGPSRQRANTEDQARPSRQRANTEDQAGPSRQRANTEDQARPSRQRANTEDQAGPSRQRANTEDQARPSRQRANTEDQAGPSRQSENTEDQARPSRQSENTEDQAGPSRQSTNSGDQAGPSRQPANTRTRVRPQRSQLKPLAVLEYNKGKGGIDLSDQMTSYASTIRKGVKWYRRVAFEILLGMSVVNSWIVYRKATNKKIQMKKFREMMVSDFFSQCPPERRPSSSQSNRQHHLQYRIAQEKKIRRPCAGCYQKLRAQNVERKDAKKKPNFVVTYCDECPKKPQLCLDCFNRLH
ncbi:hypothetical protein M8J77_012602 [Diaphorina citri]|nr:hypothetical protein M8J77_012602 [Diaphorina citri]